MTPHRIAKTVTRDGSLPSRDAGDARPMQPPDILALYRQLRDLIAAADSAGLARTGLALTQAAATLLAEGYRRDRGDTAGDRGPAVKPPL